MTTSAQLEREAEETRAGISNTLDELRAKMTPGEVVDEILDYARDSSGGLFMEHLRRQLVNNPMAVTLVGTGLVWLVMAGRRQPGNGSARISDYGQEAMERTSMAAQRAAEGATGAAEDIRQRTASAGAELSDSVRQAKSRFHESARDVKQSTVSAASGAYETAAQGARSAAKVVSSAGSNVAGASRDIAQFLREQPLLLVGLGLALGAAFGSVLPETDAEDRLMGEASDGAKKRASEIAEEKIDQGKAVAARAWESAEQEAEKQGLATPQAKANEADGNASAGSDTASNDARAFSSSQDSDTVDAGNGP